MEDLHDTSQPGATMCPSEEIPHFEAPVAESLPTAAMPSQTSSQSLSELAIGRLSKPTPEEVSALRIVCTFEDMQNSIRSLEQAVRSKDVMAYNILGRLDPLLSGIEYYTEVIGVFVQTNQAVLAPIWGSIRLLVLVLRGHTTYVDEILRKLETIYRNMPRYAEYVKRYPNRQRLAEAVTDTLLLIIEFCILVRRTLVGHQDETPLARLGRRTRPVRRSFDSIFKPILHQMVELRQQIEHEAQSAAGNSLEELRADNDRTRDLQQRTLAAAVAALDEKNLARRTQDLGDVRQYLQEADLINQAKLETLKNCRAAYPDTCRWLFEKQQFESWSSEDHGLLLVHGASGCGKSVLAAACVERFQQEKPDASPLFFFCHEGLPDHCGWESVIHSWAVTATWMPHSSALLDQFLNQVANAKRGNSLAVIRSILLCCLESSKPVIVLDGLDELRRDDRKKAMNDIFEMARSTRVLVFSQGEHGILTSFASQGGAYWNGVLAIEMNDTQEDVKRVVTKWAKARKTTKVIESILRRAQGMFLWVHFMLEELEHCDSDESFEHALELFPTGIDGYYERFVSKWLSVSSVYEHMLRTLQIVAFSVDVITLETVDGALKFQFRGRSNPVPPASTLIRRFSPLLRFDASNRIQGTHASVIEYLRTSSYLAPVDTYSSHHNPENANHAVLFRLCIQFLSATVKDEANRETISVTMRSKYSFLEYATRHVWTHLYRSGPPNTESLELLEDFFQNAGKNLLWVEIIGLLGMEYRFQDQMVIQSSFRKWREEAPRLSPANARRVQSVEDGLLSLYRSAVKFSIAKHGPNDIRTAKSVHALGSFLYQNGHLAESVGYLKDAISRYETPENYHEYQLHPEYLALLMELATCQGDIEPSNPTGAELMSRAHEGSISLYGSEHPTSIYYAVMRAEQVKGLGDYDRAIAIFLPTLETATAVLGKEHTTTLRAHHNLGKAYMAKKEYGEAEKHFLVARDTRKRVFGDKAQSTLRSMTCLGEVYWKTGRYNEAWNLIEQSRAGLRETRGSDSYFVHLATQALGDVRFHQGRFNEAIELYNDARRGLAKTGGSTQTSHIVGILEQLATAYKALGNATKASKLEKEVTKMRSRIVQASKSPSPRHRSNQVLLLSFVICFSLLLPIILASTFVRFRGWES
ncbi:hypothetical protein F5Y19DRAFT_474833 [Xylariaceae sp. FL1651]|nr:hypothetical protein F5Y19DRAFT_474833 [Xylariaceae sp. FL1651]